MLVTLDEPQCLDPAVAGAKAAWLARARQAGLPVLDGVVVSSEHSTSLLDLGAQQLELHNSGRARMAITSAELAPELRSELHEATAGLPEPMVVRSSSALEGSGVWSGAFTSYLDINRHELPKAVLGCYASAFTQATVARFEAAGVAPAAARMAVLIQPALEPDFGGTARLAGNEVVVAAVKGSPVPLVQGWDPGAHATVDEDGHPRGGAAIDLLGAELVTAVAAELRAARDAVGANACEWASSDGRIWLLQLQRFPASAAHVGSAGSHELGSAAAAGVARLIRRYPGPLGEHLVLPWAIADPSLADVAPDAADVDPLVALDEAAALAGSLTADAWGQPRGRAGPTAARALRELRGTTPDSALQSFAALRQPDRERAVELLGLLAAVRRGLAAAGAVADADSAWHVSEPRARRILAGLENPTHARIGYDRWEPFQSGVVASCGMSVTGIAAAPGVGFGRMCIAVTPAGAERFRPRDVLVATHPVPGLAALLFDAAAMVTTGGGPAAHLFESARALGIPAVCGARMEELVGSPLDAVNGSWALAVDGGMATVHGVEW